MFSKLLRNFQLGWTVFWRNNLVTLGRCIAAIVVTGSSNKGPVQIGRSLLRFLHSGLERFSKEKNTFVLNEYALVQLGKCCELHEM